MAEDDEAKRLRLEANRRLVLEALDTLEAEGQAASVCDASKLLVLLTSEVAARLDRHGDRQEIADLFIGVADAVETGAFGLSVSPYTITLEHWQRRRLHRLSTAAHR